MRIRTHSAVNLFSGCGIGIHFTAGSERNGFASNAFIGNRTQVKYVGTRWTDWSVDGKGNYWSDHAAFDLDGNGVADTAYRPPMTLWTMCCGPNLPPNFCWAPPLLSS